MNHLAVIAASTLSAAILSGAAESTLPSKTDILGAMELANNHFIKSWPVAGCGACLPGKRPSNIWTRAVYFEGALALYRINKDPIIKKYAVDWGTFHDWTFRNGDATQNPDDQCAGQIYFELDQLDPTHPERLAHTRANLDNWTKSPKLDFFTWIDTLQMSMPCFAKLGVLDNNSAYFDKMYAMYDYSKTTLGLYNPEDHLWWRDPNFKPPFTTPNNKQCYWSRGNGWIVAALARTLENLPKSDPHHEEYLQMFKGMCKALLPLQRDDGFWDVSLADPNDFGGPETTGTALFIYGMAWGINHGHLTAADYLSSVSKGWHAITHKALHQDGFLGYIQGTGHKPADGQPVAYDSVPDFDDFGLGCFLLAGSEIHTLASESKSIIRPTDVTTASSRSGPIRIVIIGDSTVCEYPVERPDRGWGQFIEPRFKGGSVKVINLAASGRSSKSFIREGRWDRALAEKPDCVLIQFGHNDSHSPDRPEATDAATDFKDNLRRYINDTRKIGAKPILVTPMVRRTFEADGTLKDILQPYSNAMEEVGAETKTLVINLHASSKQLILKLGPEASTRMANKNGDMTHFNEKGASSMADLVMTELPSAYPALRELLIAR